MPDIQLKLGNDSFQPALCEFHVGAYAQTTYLNGTIDFFLDDATPTRDGNFTRKFLFRNFAACIESSSALASINSIGFFSRTGDVSFCIEDFNLLLTEVPSPGESVSNIRFCACTDMHFARHGHAWHVDVAPLWCSDQQRLKLASLAWLQASFHSVCLLVPKRILHTSPL